MAQTIEVTAKQRSDLGSRANKRLRDTGFIPGVIYGHKQAVLPVTLPRKEVANHIHHGAHLFSLALGDQKETVLVKEVQYDHLGIEVIHIDFARVNLDESVKITVPLELKGTPKGEADGGVLQQVLAELQIECKVTDIPDIIRYNVSELVLNSVLHVKEIPLPPNVKAINDGEQIVATVREIVEQVAAAVEGETAEPEVIGRKAEEEPAAGAEGAAAPAAKK
jgi:large subunit ribosomal protein L25